MPERGVKQPNLGGGPIPSDRTNALNSQQFYQRQHELKDELRKLGVPDDVISQVKPFMPAAAQENIRARLGVRRQQYKVRTAIGADGQSVFGDAPAYQQDFNGQNKIVGAFIDEIPSAPIVDLLEQEAERAGDLAELEDLFFSGGDALIAFVAPELHALLSKPGPTAATQVEFSTDAPHASGPNALPSRIPFYSPSGEKYGNALNKFRYLVSEFYNSFYFDDMDKIRAAVRKFKAAKGLGYSGMPNKVTTGDVTKGGQLMNSSAVNADTGVAA